MKKTLAVILAVLMLVGVLAGCAKDNQNPTEGKPEETTSSEPTSPSQPNTQPTTQPQAAVGDILNAPEVRFDTSIEDLYICFTYPGESNNEVLSMEIAVDQTTEDSYVIYVTDGLLKQDEAIYEVTNAGITKYHKDVFMDNFVQDTTLSQAELKQEETSIMTLLSMFMVAHPDLQGMQYRKTDETAFAITGEVYTYDLIKSGEVWGKICIDKTTGLLVSLKDTDGTALYTVQDIKTSNLGIPAYK